MSKFAIIPHEEETLPTERNQALEPSSVAQKWKLNIKLGCATASVVFCINLAVLVYTELHRHSSHDGITILYSGTCSTTRKIGVWSHLLINMISSMLLAASNTGMQCLIAPTRKEVDCTHARGKWLDIGVHTVRNLRAVSVPRRLLWALLGLSSFPLHLMYNSVIFQVKVVNDYGVTTTTEYFVQGGPWNHSRVECITDNTARDTASASGVEYMQDSISGLTKLDKANCLRNYGQDLITEWANVLVVTDGTPFTNETVLNRITVQSKYSNSGSWVCHGIYQGPKSCVTPQTANPNNWFVPVSLNSGLDYDFGIQSDGHRFCSVRTTSTLPVKYCLAQHVPEACQVGILPGVLIAVLVCNFIKIVCLFWTFGVLSFQPLITIGDALLSFLQSPDANTLGRGLVAVDTIDHRTVTGMEWKARSRNGFDAASKTRWILSSVLFIIAWLTAVILLVINIQDQYASKSIKTIIATGLGHLDLDHMVAFISNTVWVNVIVANSPQLLVSLLYLLYNDFSTRMFIVKEWSSYSTTRQELRLSTTPSEASSLEKLKGRYILSLPYKASLPLLILIMLLHWLISQSLFLSIVGLNNYTPDPGSPRFMGYPILGLGWSAFGMFLTIILGGAMIVGLWISALCFRFNKSAPLVRTCSLLLSAACHASQDERVDAEIQVMYGVVREMSYDEKGEMVAGHACLTSQGVTPLVSGHIYA